jgi:hypothetical protein
MIQLKEYDVHYVTRKGKTGVYNTKCALCVDGAEEAARLDVRNLKEITKVVQIIRK